MSRTGERLALRLTPPAPGFAEEVRALQFWRGRGVVRLVAADLPAGAMLLERLDGSRRAEDLPVAACVALTASMMRRLAVEPPPHAVRTSDVVAARLTEMTADWEYLGRPFPARTLDAVVAAAQMLTECAEDVAVNADLHGGQVLSGRREPWCASTLGRSERARIWVAYRAADYWLWGLGNGLTEDRLRCSRLLAAVGMHRP